MLPMHHTLCISAKIFFEFQKLFVSYGILVFGCPAYPRRDRRRVLCVLPSFSAVATAQEKRTGEKKKKKKQEYLPPSRLSHHFAPEKEAAAAAVSLLLLSRPFAAGGKNDEGTRKEVDSPI